MLWKPSVKRLVRMSVGGVSLVEMVFRKDGIAAPLSRCHGDGDSEGEVRGQEQGGGGGEGEGQAGSPQSGGVSGDPRSAM